MKLIHILSILAALALASCGQPDTSKQQPISEITNDVPERLLRHVVLFNFKDDAPVEKINEIETAFAALPGRIPAIHSFEWGTNNSPEGLDKGLTHCFLVTFLSEEDRTTYLPHPAHKEFVDLIGPYVEEVTVIDYWTK
jgi:hypothetical protein